jgi:hypothetical protein
MKSLSPCHVGSPRLAVRRHRISRLALCCIFAFAFLLTACATQSFAQEATIVGTVTDPSGAAVPNVKITISNTDTGIARSISTAGDGQYAAPSLSIGHYTVRAEAPGFRADERKNVTLNLGDRSRIDFKLQVGNVQETVNVEANAVAVQTDTGEISGVITGQQITQLATNGRNVFALEPLQPGASSVQADFQVPT